MPGDGRLSQRKAAEQLEAAQAVLADTFERDGAELSAIEYRQREMANADHLGILLAMWEGETWQARDQRYREMVAAELPAGYDGELSPARRWLYRSLHSAELAGLDPQQVLRDAIASGDLAGSRDVAKVLHARIRSQRARRSRCRPGRGPSRYPRPPSPETRAFLQDLGRGGRADRPARRARRRRGTLGGGGLRPGAEDPLDRLAWQQKASAVARLPGGVRPRRPGRPDRPGADRSRVPAQAGHVARRAARARTRSTAWTCAAAPMANCGSCAAPTRRRPPGRRGIVAETLGMVRRLAEDASLDATRSEAEANVAEARGDAATAERHRQRAIASRRKEDIFRHQEGLLARTDADYRDHQPATEAQRRNAIAADMELRRRHPEQCIEPLRDAGPGAVSDEEHAEAARGDKVPEWVTRLEEAREAFTAEMEARQNVMVPAEDPEWEPEGEAFPAQAAREPDAILVPPQPEMPPSERVTGRARERDMEAEASA